MSKSWPTIRKQKRGDWVVDLGTVFGKRMCFTRQTEKEAQGVGKFYRAERERLGKLGGSLSPNAILECMRCKELLNGRSLTSAVEFYIQHNKMIVESHTVNETIAALLDQQEKKNRRPTTISTSKNRLEKFASWFGKNGGDIAIFNTKSIQGWLDHMGFTPATEIAYLRELNHLFTFAVKRGWRDGNPVANIEKPIVDRKANGILSVEDVGRLLEASKEFEGASDWLAVQLFCGLRPSEADRLKWGDISEAGIHVKSAVAKTHEERYIVMSMNLREWLLSGCESDSLLVGRKNGSKIRKKLSESLGIEWHHDCLRKTFCSYHLAMYDKPELTASIMGHVRGVALMYRHYRVPVQKEEAKKYWEINP